MGERERHRLPSQFRVVPAHEPVETPGSTPILTQKWLARTLNKLPAWAQLLVVSVGLGAGSGGLLAAAAKRIGLATAAGMTELDTRLTERLIRLETRVTETEQKRRKEGLSKQSQKDVSNLLGAALDGVSITRAPRRKPKPVHNEPAETEDQSP